MERMDIGTMQMKGFTDGVMTGACREIVLRGMDSILRDASKKDAYSKEIVRFCRELQKSDNWNGIRMVIKRRL